MSNRVANVVKRQSKRNLFAADEEFRKSLPDKPAVRPNMQPKALPCKKCESNPRAFGSSRCAQCTKEYRERNV